MEGLYTIVVTDVNSGCTITSDITVGDATILPTVTSIVVANDRCNAPFNGAILIDVSPAALILSIGLYRVDSLQTLKI